MKIVKFALCKLNIKQRLVQLQHIYKKTLCELEMLGRITEQTFRSAKLASLNFIFAGNFEVLLYL
jgi:hypothetical protein